MCLLMMNSRGLLSLVDTTELVWLIVLHMITVYIHAHFHHMAADPAPILLLHLHLYTSKNRKWWGCVWWCTCTHRALISHPRSTVWEHLLLHSIIFVQVTVYSLFYDTKLILCIAIPWIPWNTNFGPHLHGCVWQVKRRVWSSIQNNVQFIVVRNVTQTSWISVIGLNVPRK